MGGITLALHHALRRECREHRSAATSADGPSHRPTTRAEAAASHSSTACHAALKAAGAGGKIGPEAAGGTIPVAFSAAPTISTSSPPAAAAPTAAASSGSWSLAPALVKPSSPISLAAASRPQQRQQPAPQRSVVATAASSTATATLRHGRAVVTARRPLRGVVVGEEGVRVGEAHQRTRVAPLSTRPPVPGRLATRPRGELWHAAAAEAEAPLTTTGSAPEAPQGRPRPTTQWRKAAATAAGRGQRLPRC
jgi:hypothetical protein